GEHAPISATKEEVIEESRSPGEQVSYDLGKIAVEATFKVVLAIDDVRTFAARKRGFIDVNDPRMEKPLAIRHALLRAGMREPAIAIGKRRKRYAVDLGDKFGKQVVLTYIVANFE